MAPCDEVYEVSSNSMPRFVGVVADQKWERTVGRTVCSLYDFQLTDIYYEKAFQQSDTNDKCIIHRSDKRTQSLKNHEQENSDPQTSHTGFSKADLSRGLHYIQLSTTQGGGKEIKSEM